jgi:hypothetical protein
MCEPEIADISKACGVTYIKGLKNKVHVTGLNEVTTIASPGTGTMQVASLTFRTAVTGPPAIAAGTWKTWEISKLDGSYKSEPTGDIDNPTITTTVGFFIYGLSSSKSYVANQTLGQDFILVAKDNNGNNRLIGEVGRGCTIKIIEQTNDKAGYLCEASWESSHYPYYFTGTLPS